MAGRVEGKVVVVTGAGSGMGRGIATSLAEEGARVVIADVNLDAARKVEAEIAASGGQSVAVQADVSVRADLVGVVDAAVSTFDRLDIWFNNAGFNRPLQFLDVTEENWTSIMDVNALGTLMGMQEAARQFIRQGGGGKIINTTSMAGRQGFPTFAPYSASKAAVISLTQSAARALAGNDITVNAFAPGVVDTPLWVKLDEDLYEIGDLDEPGQAMVEFTKGILRGRTAQVSDIMGTTLYLASSDSDYLTGQVIMIDGGMVLV
jgi:meso-butanediol dehydrogenase/(S,S)-butanediol dehydrogenase/diacetyl reductase